MRAKVGQVTATFRLRYLKEIFINSLGVNKQGLPLLIATGLKPEATRGFRYKSLNLGYNNPVLVIGNGEVSHIFWCGTGDIKV